MSCFIFTKNKNLYFVIILLVRTFDEQKFIFARQMLQMHFCNQNITVEQNFLIKINHLYDKNARVRVTVLYFLPNKKEMQSKCRTYAKHFPLENVRVAKMYKYIFALPCAAQKTKTQSFKESMTLTA